MGFDALLGNERLKENIRRSIGRGRISHFYLICGPEGAGKRTLARLMAAAILCREPEKPCLRCASCRKVMNNSHPDFITIDDPEKKTVPVDLIRQARADIYVRPNEADKKIYLFPRGQDMGLPGQNALLKVLEEPPEYGVFFLLADNPEKLLPTVRSRCTELALTALPEELVRDWLVKEFPQAQADQIASAVSRSGGYLGQAKAILEAGADVSEQTQQFAQCMKTRDSLALTRMLVGMEKWKRDQLIQQLRQWTELVHGALLYRSGMAAPSALARELGTERSSEDLMAILVHLQKATTYAQSNVSAAAVCGNLVWVLR